MYQPDFHPQHKVTRRSAFFTRIYRLKTDKHRSVWYSKATERIKTRQYPHLYPLTRRATDFGV